MRKSNKGISDIEIKIIKLIANGKSNKGIGKELFLSESTVKKHISKIFCKFGVKDRLELIVYCLKNNIIK